MRAVVQRVAEASVTVGGEAVGAISRGLLVYLGCGKGDTRDDAAWMLEKILGLRIFENAEGKMDTSVLDAGGALLVVSQFTLYGDVRKGRRPSFEGAMAPAEAKELYAAFCAAARARIHVEEGRFQADMRVSSVNEGPVTIWIESPKRAEMGA